MMRREAVRSLGAGLAVLILMSVGACGKEPDRQRWPVIGDAAQGKIWTERMGCGSCHLIPGIQGADGLVGPPLMQFSRRTIVAGILPNTPRNLAYWIRTPQAVIPGNAMPDAELTETQANDIAAYLETLD